MGAMYIPNTSASYDIVPHETFAQLKTSHAHCLNAAC